MSLRIGVLTSGGLGNLGAVMRLAERRPDLINLAAVASDRPSSPGVSLARRHGLPVIARDFREECGRGSYATDPAAQAAYAMRAEQFHDRLDAALQELEGAEGRLDLLVLAYRRWIHGKLLDRFAGRMINQHPGDLTALDQHGRRQLVGSNPVLSALRMGHRCVRTTTFLVDEGHDTGAIICQGPWVPTGASAPDQPSADRLETEQKRASDWPSLVCALTLFARSAITLDTERQCPDGSPGLSLCGHPLPFGGIQLMRALEDPPAGLAPILSDVAEAIALCAWE